MVVWVHKRCAEVVRNQLNRGEVCDKRDLIRQATFGLWLGAAAHIKFYREQLKRSLAEVAGNASF